MQRIILSVVALFMLQNVIATELGQYPLYVTQPLATEAEAQTYINALEALENPPTELITMMVNESGAKVQAGVIATAAAGKFQVICNFNLGRNIDINAKTSFAALQANDPSICSGGFAIDYEPADSGENFHLEYFQQLIPLLRGVAETAPIYLYFNPNQMLSLSTIKPAEFSQFVKFLQQQNVIMLWAVYSIPNTNNLSQLFTEYPALKALPYRLLFNILNSSTAQQTIIENLTEKKLIQSNKAFWEVISSKNCPVNQEATCQKNIEASLSLF